MSLHTCIMLYMYVTINMLKSGLSFLQPADCKKSRVEYCFVSSATACLMRTVVSPSLYIYIYVYM